jgi:hypothetical protein
MTLEDDRIVPGKFRFPGKPDEEWPRLYLTKICQYLTKMLQDLDPDYGNPGRKAETFLQELDMPRERILGMMDREAEHLAPFTDETEGSQGTDC